MAVPHLVAHRGQMEHYPENTLIGLEAALQSGACFIEFDVQSTADGKLVVMHDVELKRTTGVEGNLFEMTHDELENIRAYEPERFSQTFIEQRIPDLNDVIGLLQRYPKAKAFVEIKEESMHHFGMEIIMSNLLRELRIIHQQCIIISFDYEAIRYVKKHSDYLTGWVLHKYDDNSHQQADILKADYLIINHRKLPANKKPWQGAWQWMVYDITDPEKAIHYANLNIMLVESRDVRSMLEHPVLMLNACNHNK